MPKDAKEGEYYFLDLTGSYYVVKNINGRLSFRNGSIMPPAGIDDSKIKVIVESKQVKEEKEESEEDKKDELKDLEKDLKDAKKDGDKEEIKDIQDEIKDIKDELKPEDKKDEKKENRIIKSISEESDTFKCPDCGNKVSEKSGYCMSCKKKVKDDDKEKKTEEKEIKDGDEDTKNLQNNMNAAVDTMEKDIKKEDYADASVSDIEMLDDENEKLEDAAPASVPTSTGATTPSDINAFTKDDVGMITPVSVSPEKIKEDENEIMYMGDDEDEIEELFDAMDDVGNDKVIDFIVDKYDSNNEDDVLFSDNYKEDLKVTDKDKVYEARGYKFIYNKEDKKVSLLRSKKNYTESKKTKKAKYQKEDMSNYEAVFNSHVNNAEDKAIKDFKKKYGDDIFNKEIKKFLNKGIMSIFRSQPNEYTLWFVNRITDYVNNNIIFESKQYQKEESRTSDEIRDWETKNRINFQSNYAKPTRQKAFRNMYVEEKEIKENVKQFLESEKIKCELEDINFVNLKVFEESVKEKKMTFFEEIKDKVTNDIYKVGIFGNDSYCLVCKK